MTASNHRTRSRSLRRRSRLALVEPLEPRLALDARPAITEFLASNDRGLVDGNAAANDWIEIQNQGDAAIDLAGWHLTDDPANLVKWTFPSAAPSQLDAGEFLVLFASGSSDPALVDSGGYLHTSFRLDAGGEYLALVAPDGVTIASEFGLGGSPFPPQREDVSYGVARPLLQSVTLVSDGSPGRLTTFGASLPGDWSSPEFDDSAAAWGDVSLPVGFETVIDGGIAAYRAAVAQNAPARYYHLDDVLTASTDAIRDDGGDRANASEVAGAGGNTLTAAVGGQAGATSGSLAFDFPSLPAGSGPNTGFTVTPNPLNSGALSIEYFIKQPPIVAPNCCGHWWGGIGVVDGERGGGGNDFGTSLLEVGGSTRLAFGVGNPETTIVTPTAIDDGAWHHVVAVYTAATIVGGKNLFLYVDGQLVADGRGGIDPRNYSQEIRVGEHPPNHPLQNDPFTGLLDEVALYRTALTGADAAFHYNAATTGVRSLPLATDIERDTSLQMFGATAAALLRVPFAVADPAAFDSLTLEMRYDDGFVAYLNGELVAQVNAPVVLDPASTATGERALGDVLAPQRFDITGHLGALRPGENVLAIVGLNASVADTEFMLAPKLTAVDLGVPTVGFFPTPTPGAANTDLLLGFVDDTTFSVDRGFFEAPFDVAIATATPGATIAYTTDGSTPTPTNGVQVAAASADAAPSAVVHIASTATLRATAYKPGFGAANVDTQTYLFLDDVLGQGDSSNGGYWGNTEMDPEVVNRAQTYSVAEALTAIPTMSLVLDRSAVFGQSGIYTNPYSRGTDWEKPVSVEYFDPGGAAEFQIDAGVQIQGGVSRDPSRPKKSFRLTFRDEYGAGKLQFPLFGPESVDRFDTLVLRAGHNYNWANEGGRPLSGAQYVRDEFTRRTQLALSGEASRGTFVHLYLNGVYWGLYNVAERPDDSFAAEHFGGAKEDYDAIKPDNNGGLELISGDFAAWNALFALGDAAVASGAIDNAELAAIGEYLDFEALVDYMLTLFYTGDEDAPTLIGNGVAPRNFYATRRREPGAGFRFFVWDGELSLDSVTRDRTETAGASNPARLFQQLRTNAQFRLLAADRIHRHFAPGGALAVNATENVPRDRYAALTTFIDRAIVAESARWGDAKRTAPLTRDVEWVAQRDWLLNTFFPQRSSVVLAQLKQDFSNLNVDAPHFLVGGVERAGGEVVQGETLALQSAAGTIYYTLDGTDPLVTASGSLAPGAIVYAGQPLTLDATVAVEARAVSGSPATGTWSAKSEGVFVVDVPIRITEINYHPAPPSALELAAGFTDDDDFEFLELANINASHVANLAGVRISGGVQWSAGAATLAPGEHAVVVRNAAAFAFRYGPNVRILGAYGEGVGDFKLDNSGEALALLDAGGGEILAFAYDDRWYPATDGSGRTLAVVDAVANKASWSTAAAWRASRDALGSPGGPDILRGDLDADDDVDLADLALLQSRLGETSVGGLAAGDLDQNGLIDRVDTRRLAQNFGRSAAQQAATRQTAAVLASAGQQPIALRRTPRGAPAGLRAQAVDRLMGASFSSEPSELRALRANRLAKEHRAMRVAPPVE